MQSNDLVLLRRKELVGGVALLAWLLVPLFRNVPGSGFFVLIAWPLTAIWVALDDYSRRGRYAAWTLFTLVTGPFGWALYCLTRKPIPTICSQCGTAKQDPMQPCATCGYATVFAKTRLALVGICKGLHDSLVRSPAEQAKETAKQVSFALAAVTIIGLWLVNAPGMLGAARAPVALIWALSAAAYWVLVAWWVYLDAAWRRMDGVPWAVLTLLTNVVGLVTYLVIRYPDPRSCPHCGASIPLGRKYCPFCGSEAESMCPHCQASVKSGWQFCPVCAARLSPREGIGQDSPQPEPVSAGTVTITGSVLDAGQGTPIAGAQVAIDSPSANLSAITDALGKFRLSGLEQRPYVLIASMDGYLPQAKPYSPGEGARNLCFTLYIG